MLSQLPKQTDKNLLVGFDTKDDAGVYLIGENQALVQTVDFFTPIVDDPFEYGQISAANSLSDIYAMGGNPISSLTIVGFPRSGQDFGILEQILVGGMSKMTEARCTVVGGHCIGDEEIKFGYAVTGLIDPKKVIRNVGARVGDQLILTKPLGTGVIGTAIKKGVAPQPVVRSAIRWMTRLNRSASEIARTFEIHAMTDITGFGFLGHAKEMAQGSGVSLEFDHKSIPAMDGALECIQQKMIPAGLLNNREYAEPLVEFSSTVSEQQRSLLFDPQTSGGLLIACRSKDAESLISKMNNQGIPAVSVGRAVEKRSLHLYVL